jgi:hypothetical protein
MTSYKGAARPAQARDRAAVVATAILAIVVDALRQWLRGEAVDLTDVRGYVESLIRDDYDDIKREIAGERIAGLD